MCAYSKKNASAENGSAAGAAWSPRNIPSATKAPLPQKLSPQLATLSATIPTEGEWLYEIKLDGYRLMARFDQGKAALITRGGHNWSVKLPRLISELEALGVRSGWLDGEIVVLRSDGTPDFNALQNSLDSNKSQDVVYFLFDVPFFEGYDLRKAQLRHRRGVLESILAGNAGSHIRLSETFEGNPASILDAACKMKLEGIIAKRADASYASRRTADWLKLKCKHRQEFVVVGYTDRSDGSDEVGSLILAVYDNGALVPLGSVGTGWNAKEATTLKHTLAQIERDTPPFSGEVKNPGRWSKRKLGGEIWVEPRLVAEVEFSEWTPDGSIRHPSYISLRSDKPPKSVTREKPQNG